MRYTMQAVALAGLIGAGLAAPSAAQAACSGGSVLKGPFGVLVNGASPTVLRFVSGVLTFDGNCNITGTLYTSVNNVVSTLVPATGTYNQNADKTFTLNLTPQGQSTQTYAVAYSTTALEALGIEQDSSGVTASIDLQAQVIQTTVTSTSTTTTPCPIPLLCVLFPPKSTTTTTTTPAPALTYNNATIAGTFVASCFSAFGSTDLNYVTFDGKGGITATSEDYYNNSGSAAASSYGGSYVVLSNGLLGGTANLSNGASFSFAGVVDNQQTELQYFYFQGGAGVTACTGKKL